MDLERFRTSPSGRLARAGQEPGVYWAFVPHALPPPLSLDPPMVRLLSDADRALGELAGLARTIPNPSLLIPPFLRREAVMSSRIEGTRAGLADLYAYEAGLPASPPSDVREVHNYVRALEYGLERIRTLPASLRLLRELHEHLMDGVRGEQATPGEFRRSQNWIGPPGCTLNQAHFVPPPVPEMTEALDAFEKYLHADDIHPPLVRLALIHYQFEAIHPFLDGNGRIGRLLISLLLAHWNLLPLPLLYLSAFFERNRQQYYDLLLAVSERGAWPDWVSYFLRGVLAQSADAIGRAKRLQDLQTDWRSRLIRARVSAMTLRLADLLFQYPILTVQQAADVLGASYNAAKKTFGKLVEAGILQELEGSIRPKAFLANEIQEIVESEM